MLALIAVLIATPVELGASTAPLADIYQLATSDNPWFISAVSLFAVVNRGLFKLLWAHGCSIDWLNRA